MSDHKHGEMDITERTGFWFIKFGIYVALFSVFNWSSWQFLIPNFLQLFSCH